ncbi:MAG: VWA-like domain-containing protein [Lachnospiraceae bacterium]|nr:VWA-like domain-containing protein [Lachnospiraceae bacterium]
MGVIYDEQARTAAFEDIARDILRGAQNELYLNMRFLDVALSLLAFSPDAQIRTAGTDGSSYYFQPDQIVSVFRKGRERINRLYLHSILHCLFAHPWVRGDRDPEYWNLACDVAAEAVIDGLYIRAVHCPQSALRREFYRTLRTTDVPVLVCSTDSFSKSFSSGISSKNASSQTSSFSKDRPVRTDVYLNDLNSRMDTDTHSSDQRIYTNGSPAPTDVRSDRPALTSEKTSRPALTAQRVYRILCAIHPDRAQLDRLKREFTVDDHSRWELPKDPHQHNPSPSTQSAGADSLDDSQDTKQESDNINPSLANAKKKWDDIRDRMQTELETFGKDTSDDVKALEEQVCAANWHRYDYRDFLRKFSVLKEEMQVDLDSFDYIYYHYGMDLYGNLPLIEPLETKEVKKIEDFVIVLDTSMSCQGDLLLHFLEETYSILSESESFFRKIHIHILQCDDRVQEDVLITNHEEMQRYLEHFTIRGFGGTDFRPPFARVKELMCKGCFTKLRGLIYFTDGYGIFPVKKPPYDTAFVFLREDYRDVDVPPWAIKLIVDEEDLMKR